MQKIYPFMLIALLLSGCTSNLTVSDYESEEEYYSVLRERSDGKKVKIETEDSYVELEDLMVDGDSVRGNTYKYDTSGSSPFINHKAMIYPISIAADNIKSIRITERGFSTLNGIAVGIFTGVIAGGVFLDIEGGYSNSGYHPDYYLPLVVGGLAGILVGGITGFITGNDIVFSKDELSRDELYKTNSVHKMGLKLGYHRGYNVSSVPQEGRSYGGADGTGKPGISVTLYYNYVLGKNISLNNELSFVSAGSEEKYWIAGFTGVEPGKPTSFAGNGIEKVSLLEIAPIFRINFAKQGFTPYLLFGPKFCLQFPGDNSIKEKFYSDINSQYGSSDFKVTGTYKNTFWGGVIGAGFSTGKLTPYEILVEVKYCKDLSGRFDVNYYNANTWPDRSKYWSNEHQAGEIIFNIGVGIF